MWCFTSVSLVSIPCLLSKWKYVLGWGRDTMTLGAFKSDYPRITSCRSFPPSLQLPESSMVPSATAGGCSSDFLDHLARCPL